VVPNAVDPELFTPEIDGTATRRRLGIDGRFVVGFTGSLKPWHDLRTLIEAAGSSRPPVAVLLVGEGPERRRLEDLATGVGATIVFAGPVSHAEVPRYLAAMDVCFAGLPADPAVQYFSPLKAMEYLAAGRATVAARAGSLQPVIDAGAALGYRPGDADDLAATLRSLMENEELRTRIARAGQGYARERTWANAARATVDAIGGLAGPAADS
jgi:glycosyltransferase involved in cell wall biosynthesis